MYYVAEILKYEGKTSGYTLRDLTREIRVKRSDIANFVRKFGLPDNAVLVKDAFRGKQGVRIPVRELSVTKGRTRKSVSEDQIKDLKRSEVNKELYFDVLCDMAQAIYKAKKSRAFVLTGAFVLGNILFEKGKADIVRKTTDLDFEVGTMQDCKWLYENIEKILNKGTLLNGKYEMVNGWIAHPTKNSHGAKIVLKFVKNTGGKFGIKIDLNVIPFTSNLKYKMYSLGVEFDGKALLDMICIKISIASKQVLCRRMKDLYDIYVVAKSFNFKMSKIVNRTRQMKLDINIPYFFFDFGNPAIRAAYENYGIEGTSKPSFDEIMKVTCAFLVPVVVALTSRIDNEMVWNRSVWEEILK